MGAYTSHGHALDTSAACFGELRGSHDLLGDPEALRRRLSDEGYLYLPGVLDRDAVLAARREILMKLAAVGDLDERQPLMSGVASGRPRRSDVDGRELAHSLRTGPAVRALCHRGRVLRFYEELLGGPVRPLDYIWVRTVRVGGATGCHYDWVYMGRGTRDLFTSWIPLGDVPLEEGPLAILEGSHRLRDLIDTYGALDVDRDADSNPYGGGWLSTDPAEVQRQHGGRWLTANFRAGDMVVFGMFTLHCSLDNRSPQNRIRVSTDSRYQLASEPADERWIGAEPMGHAEAHLNHSR